jgi:hypothetical protein
LRNGGLECIGSAKSVFACRQDGFYAQKIFGWISSDPAILCAAGIPGGLAMLGTAPADFAQFYAHVFRVAQKLAYVSGRKDKNEIYA